MSTNTMKLIRGKRIVDALTYLQEDATYPQLYTNIQRGFPDTKKRQHVANQVNVVKIQYVPIEGNKVLQVNATTVSNGNRHTPAAQFTNVQYQQEETSDAVTFKGTDNADHTIKQIDLSSTNVKVRCTCLDFHFRFSWQNYSDNSLVGNPPPIYRRKTTTRPPANPTEVPGLCKHLVRLFDVLKRNRLVR